MLKLVKVNEKENNYKVTKVVCTRPTLNVTNITYRVAIGTLSVIKISFLQHCLFSYELIFF